MIRVIGCAASCRRKSRSPPSTPLSLHQRCLLPRGCCWILVSAALGLLNVSIWCRFDEFDEYRPEDIRIEDSAATDASLCAR